MIIRAEENTEIETIYNLNVLAFGQSAEASIIDRLRQSGCNLLSLVAIENEKIIGHILFSPAMIKGPNGTMTGMGLAPLAVSPESQRQGVGTQLVKKGIEELKYAHCPFILVLGHSEYYTRFGFEKASAYGIECQWAGVPDEAFMILWLDKSEAGKVTGIAKYRDEFNDAI
jgi:putative acetyltransferase